jgi:hypothetical protein
MCLVWRIAFEDRSGRFVEARLVPVLVRVDLSILHNAQSRRTQVWPLLRGAEDGTRAQVEAACDQWTDSATQAVYAFVEARLAREEAIAALPRRPLLPSQPGLFDRRIERAQQAQVAMNDRAEAAALDRVRSIGDTGAIVRQPARLLLVLVP